MAKKMQRQQQRPQQSRARQVVQRIEVPIPVMRNASMAMMPAARQRPKQATDRAMVNARVIGIGLLAAAVGAAAGGGAARIGMKTRTVATGMTVAGAAIAIMAKSAEGKAAGLGLAGAGAGQLTIDWMAKRQERADKEAHAASAVQAALKPARVEVLPPGSVPKAAVLANAPGKPRGEGMPEHVARAFDQVRRVS